MPLPRDNCQKLRGLMASSSRILLALSAFRSQPRVLQSCEMNVSNGLVRLCVPNVFAP
jgi:hypothetical protein